MAKKAAEPFINAVRREFAFLTDELGFTEVPTPKQCHEFSVWFENDTTRLVVESINWGTNSRVALGSAGAIDTFENYDLFDCVAVASPDWEIDTESLPSRALDQLSFMAETLRQFATPVLHGNFALFAGVKKIVAARRAEWEAKR